MALLNSVSAGEMASPTWAYLLHLLYIFVFMIFAIRRLQTYLFLTKMGPKVLMLRGIFVDFFHFLTILLVFWVAYGVGSFAMMRPLKAGVGLDDEGRIYDVAKVILDPYWALFGTNTDFAGELKDGKASLKNATVLPSKEHKKIITDIILPFTQAIYMMFGAFLLLNLIIALFSNTIDNVNKESKKYWKFSRVELVHEYQCKPWTPPPFSMVG